MGPVPRQEAFLAHATFVADPVRSREPFALSWETWSPKARVAVAAGLAKSLIVPALPAQGRVECGPPGLFRWIFPVVLRRDSAFTCPGRAKLGTVAGQRVDLYLEFTVRGDSILFPFRG